MFRILGVWVVLEGENRLFVIECSMVRRERNGISV